MKAIAIKPGTKELYLTDRPEPDLQQDDDVKLKVWQVGICGTDREEVSGGRADAPHGKNELIIGHEMFGKVVQTGARVTKVKKGDFGVFMVRRGCGECDACNNNRSDMCYTGNYKERGIKEADGYQTEFVVDREQYFVKVPESITDIGVLTEPMSVAAKAIDEAIQIQAARLGDFDDPAQWLRGKNVLVAGIGVIGLMAAFALRSKGANVAGLDIVNEGSLRPSVLKAIGGTYINGKEMKVTDIDTRVGQFDFIFEAAGIANLQFQLIDALGINAVYVATGIPAGNRQLTIQGGALMKQLVLKNQVILGSVNAGMRHYEQAVDYLVESRKRWTSAIHQIITNRFSYKDYEQALRHHDADEIKVVVDWHTGV